MSREEILAEIDRLKDELQRSKDAIYEARGEIPQAIRNDRKSMRRIISGKGKPGAGGGSEESSIRDFIYREQKTHDEIKAKINQLKSQLRAPSTPPANSLNQMLCPQMIGIVKWYSDEKEYGFIQVEGQQDDVIVRKSSLPIGVILKTGDKVKFKCVERQKGFKAIDVRLYIVPEKITFSTSI